MSELFKDWLKETRELQIGSFGTDPAQLDGADRVEYVRWNVLAAHDELSEVLGEISWKPWASASFFNRDEYIGEVVDVLHFAANLLVAAGCTDEELDARYTAKMQKNRDRQAASYTGTHKCPRCRRAFDDVAQAPDRDICVLCATEEEAA
jgi:hypothetical protein